MSERHATQRLSARDAAKIVGVDVSTMRKYGQQGRLPSTKDSQGQRWFARHDVETFAATRQKTPQPSTQQTDMPLGLPAAPTPAQPMRQRPPAARVPIVDHAHAPERLTLSEAAAVTGMSERSIRRWIQDNKIQVERWIPVSELERLGYAVSPEHFTTPPVDPQVAALQHLVAVLERELEDAKDRERRLLTIVESATLPPVRSSSPPSPQDLADLRSRPPTKWQRILEYVLNSSRPRRSWQVQRALGLETSPHRELSRLVRDKKLIRVSDGLFARPDWQPGEATHGQEEANDEADAGEEHAPLECC